jgi:hypothetical protein
MKAIAARFAAVGTLFGFGGKIVAGRGRSAGPGQVGLSLDLDESAVEVNVAPGLDVAIDRDDLLKIYIESICGSVTEHSRKLPRAVSTDLSKALSLVVADDLSREIGKDVYMKTAKPSRAAFETAAEYRTAADDWAATHQGRTMSLDQIWVGEMDISGGIKHQQMDIVLASPRDGLALAVDVKGLNTRENAGKNLKNRLGDFVSISVNFHLRFPYAAIGGVLAVPSDISESQLRKGIRIAEGLAGRVSPSEGPERFEAFALLVFDCETLAPSSTWPDPDSPVRYENFVLALRDAFERRFGE